MVKAKKWTKCKDFVGIPTQENFQLIEEDLPELQDGGRENGKKGIPVVVSKYP